MRTVANILAAVVLIAYPLLVYFGLSRWSVRRFGLLLIVVFFVTWLVRVRRFAARHLWAVGRIPLVAGTLVSTAMLLDDPLLLLLLPVLINATLLVLFAGSLAGEIPMVEHFARLQTPELSLEQSRYCRTLTVVWCCFFLFNGTAAALLACLAPMSWWTIYNGGIAYVLMGALFAGEYVVRKYRFRDFNGRFLDRLLAAVLPDRRDRS